MSANAGERALAPAKVNLALVVHGRRDDGYHELTTWMACLDLLDELEVSPRAAPGIELAVVGPCAGPDVPADASNLAWRAARAALERRGRDPAGPRAGLQLRLTKRIPAGAGLGGGSSDAAAAILAAERALGLPPDPGWRRRTLAGLGADCVFFHDVGESGIARCEGIGERVTPIAGRTPAWTVAWIAPAAGCSTRAVYAALDAEWVPARARASELPPGEAALAEAPAAALRAPAFRNDLEEAALRVAPELRRWRELLDASGAEHFRLTGSGSTFFGAYDSATAAEADCARLLASAGRAGLPVRAHGSSRVRSGGAALLESGAARP